MFDLETLVSKQFIASVLTGLAVMATIISVAAPYFDSDKLSKRMKMVIEERELIRQRERARMQKGLRYQPKVYMKRVVDRFSLADWLNADGIKARLLQAGFRGPQGEIAFLFARFVTPLGFFFGSILGLIMFPELELDWVTTIGVVVAATFAGIKAPELYVANTISKRQAEMARAFPDSLDLMLICVESGMSIDHAVRKVSQEIGQQSIALAEEFGLASAELSYLSERRVAYENLGERTGIDSVRQIMTVLIQAEKFGTPLVNALRLAAQESRDARMMEAERKAAALPPKLTVPMIVFFLPALFSVVMGPAAMQVMNM